MRAATIGAPVLAVLTVLLVTRCVAAGPDAHSAAGHMPLHSNVTSAPTGAPAGANATDVAWLQLMIPMTEQAIRLMESAPARTSNARIIRLAAEMSAVHLRQSRTLRDLLRRIGAPLTNMHEGHNMPGMVTAAELQSIEQVGDAAFDRLFTQHIGEYLRQSVLIAGGEQQSGADRDTTAFAATLAKARAGDLAQLTGDAADGDARGSGGSGSGSATKGGDVGSPTSRPLVQVNDAPSADVS
ncbi:DUF305 domain-containing protein [Planotetraspora sp. A-T 1434]|uniref:DUF305 domain-containing protein n=1 Tax=Planotetraspora sp. A-T 1434 TaxID=2979219 RepID=UPI0021C00C9B|nr:DUF305 domain-containing protein [Planotetraspora sp. A-T 1434]MCT9934826.1 DUF305 domain-containing protein [Planotetraspora sp. A-T 1434]